MIYFNEKNVILVTYLDKKMLLISLVLYLFSKMIVGSAAKIKKYSEDSVQ